jgi:hypothetical protein
MNLKDFFFKQILPVKILTFAVPAMALAGMLYVGFSSSCPMIGDETAHYYQLVNQSGKLPGIAFGWSLITDYGKERSGIGPHVIGWHYLGAAFYKMAPRFMTVQFYHLFFFCLLIVFSFLTARHLFNTPEATCNTLLLISSLPAVILFGTAFYQDLPATALIVAAFYLLFKRIYLPGILLVAITFFFKENSVLMLPGMCLLIFFQERRKPLKCSVWITASVFLALTCIIIFDVAVFKYFDGKCHNILVDKILDILRGLNIIEDARPPMPPQTGALPPIAYPGDLRIAANWIIYLGGAIWLAAGAAIFGLWREIKDRKLEQPSFICAFIGLSYLIPAYIIGRNTPDIRYFLPGIPFLIFAVSHWLASFKDYRKLLPVIAAAAIVQSGATLAKIYELRNLGPDLEQVIKALNEKKSACDNKKFKIFMYAEKWRFLPYEPAWSISVDVWKAKTDRQIYDLLRNNNFAFIGIEKSKIASLVSSNVDIRVYPLKFADALANSDLFSKVCENKTYLIYELKPDAQ